MVCFVICINGSKTAIQCTKQKRKAKEQGRVDNIGHKDTKRKRKEVKIRNKKTYTIQKATEISNAGQHTPIVV